MTAFADGLRSHANAYQARALDLAGFSSWFLHAVLDTPPNPDPNDQILSREVAALLQRFRREALPEAAFRTLLREITNTAYTPLENWQHDPARELVDRTFHPPLPLDDPDDDTREDADAGRPEADR